MEPIIIEEYARMLEDRAEARGQLAGELRGKLEGARTAVYDLCEAFEIAIDEERRAFVAGATADQLDGLRASLKQRRAWPAPHGEQG